MIDNYQDFPKENWQLITGKGPSEVMKSLDMKFDFAVIDSGHTHPCETLNFIEILPYLNDGAIVVLHDVILYSFYFRDKTAASTLLFMSVCAEKLLPKSCEPRPFHNIAAFQVSQDTRKYINNVFEALLFPWGYFDEKYCMSVYSLVKEHYSQRQISTFEMAVDINKTFKPKEKISYKKLSLLDNDTIFYGAGNNCREILKELLDNDIYPDINIWDKAANEIGKMLYLPVSHPDFEKKARSGQIMVITIVNKEIADTVRKQFEPLGYTVYHGVGELIKA